jgi:hypothetical protein
LSELPLSAGSLQHLTKNGTIRSEERIFSPALVMIRAAGGLHLILAVTLGVLGPGADEGVH